MFNNKKSKILTIILFCIPLFIAIGFSSWIIIYETVFAPSYYENPISEAFGFTQETTYNGQEQAPIPLDGYVINGTITYEYKLENEQDYTSGKPIDAGTYDVKIDVSGENGGKCQVKFTILPKKIKLSETTININYGDAQRYWSDFGAKVKAKISFKDENSNAYTFADSADYSIKGMHNGLYYYGENGYSVSGLTTTTNIAGSTYTATVDLHEEIEKNFTFIAGNTIIIKFNTVIVNGTYTTIEEAIKSNPSKITFAGDSSKNTEYVETVFSCLTDKQGNPYTKTAGYYTEDTVNFKDKKVFTLNSTTLLVNYDSSGNLQTTNETNHSSGNVYSCLHIPSNIALVIKSGSLQIGGIIGINGSISTHGVILNKGIISIDSSTLYSYGFLKGTGFVDIKNNSTAYDIMRMFDWPGGSAASGMAGSAFPVIAWSAHNISCPTRIYKGSVLKGYSSFSVSIIGYQKPEFTIIGASSSTSDCLFKPSSSSAATDYILKEGTSTNNTINTSITEYNQVRGQKDKITVNGDYEDASLKVSISFYSFKTSTSICVPIGFMDIIIKDGSVLNISSSSYVFMLGTSLKVDKNATLNISGNAYIAFDKMTGTEASTAVINPWFAKTYCKNVKDAEFILNGTLGGTGKVGGNVKTEVAGAQSTISNYSISSIKMKYDAGNANERLSSDYLLYGNIGNANGYNNSTFTNGTSYVSTTLDSSNYYFTAATNVKTFELKFYDSDKSTLLDTMQVQVLLPNDDGSYTYTITGKEFEPSKIHYDFSKWYLLSNNNIAENTILTFNESDNSKNTISLYASWSEHEYTISYTAGYEDSSNNNQIIEIINTDVNYQNVLSSFKLSDLTNDSINITTTASYNEKIFNGWYIGYDNSSNVKLTKLTKQNIELFVETYGADTPIPLYCLFTDYSYYTIVFDDRNNDFDDPESIVNIKNTDTITLPNMSSLDNDVTKPLYFAYWSFLSEPTDQTKVFNGQTIQNLIDSIETYNLNNPNNEVIIDNNSIVLYCEWNNKNVVSFYDEDGKTLLANQYYLDNSSVNWISNPSNKYAEGTNYDTNKTFKSWIYNNLEYTSNSTFKVADNVSFIASYSTKYIYKLTVDVDKSTITVGGTSYTTDTVLTYEVSNTTDTVSISYSATGNSTKYLKVDWDGNEKYADSNTTFSGTEKLSKHTTLYAIGTNDSSICIKEGTLITLYDGSKKKIEDLDEKDMIKVFNHETGQMDISVISFIIHKEGQYDYFDIMKLEFENFMELEVAGEHGLFDKTLNKYVYINENNVKDYLGHEFFVEDGTTTKLVDYSITEEYTRIFSPISYYHLNVFANGILTVTNFSEVATNIFEYDENMKYDEEKMMKDIETYGLFTYEDFKAHTTEEIYNAFPAQYFKVAIGKGKGTYEDIIWILYTFLQ